MWKLVTGCFIGALALLGTQQHDHARSYFYAAHEYIQGFASGKEPPSNTSFQTIDQLYQKAVYLSPGNYLFIHAYVQFLYSHKRYHKIIELLESSLDFPFHNLQKADLYNSLAWAYVQLKSQEYANKALHYALLLYQILNTSWNEYSSDQIALYLDTLAEAHFVNDLHEQAKDFGLQALKIVQNQLYKKEIEQRVKRYIQYFKK